MPAIGMYDASATLFIRQLNGLATCLDKAQAHCDAKKIDPNALLGARLYPDMFSFTRQVQIACDHAKGAMARLAGQEVPAYPDNEASFAELKARVAKTVDFVKSVGAQVNGAEDRKVTVQMRAGPVEFTGLSYLQNSALPNFFFHVTTAYDILRHNGLDLGKKDFLVGAFELPQ